MAFSSRVVERSATLCLVERTNALTGSVHWEVWRMRWREARVGPGGESFPAREYLPSTSEWGERGWTYTRRTDAIQKYRDCLDALAETGVSGPAKGMVAPGQII